jgi:hypothetical protein
VPVLRGALANHALRDAAVVDAVMHIMLHKDCTTEPKWPLLMRPLRSPSTSAGTSALRPGAAVTVMVYREGLSLLEYCRQKAREFDSAKTGLPGMSIPVRFHSHVFPA